MYQNRVEIIGGLVREPELRFLPSGLAVAEFSVACARAAWDPETRAEEVRTTFVSVQAWGSLGEQIAEMGLQRGDSIYVLGELSQQEYEKRDGTKESKTRVEAAIVQPIRQKSATARPATGGQWAPPPPPPGQSVTYPEPPPAYDEPPFAFPYEGRARRWT